MDLGLEQAGWTCRWQAEIIPYRRRILGRHWSVLRHGDVTKIDPAGLEPVDLICGGFPCQDLSVAGLRAGLAGKRSSLFHEFARIVAGVRPTWVLVENVPGLLSSARGRDFAIVLSTLDELGYGLSWRVLDSRHFGVPQRRRRVFIVGRLGAIPAAEILFERGRLPGDPETSPEEGPGAPAVARASAAVTRKWAKGTGGHAGAEEMNLAPVDAPDLAATLKGHQGKAGSGIGPEQTFVSALAASTGGADDNDAQAGHLVAFDPAEDDYAHALTAEGFDASEDGTGRGTPLVAATGFHTTQDPISQDDTSLPLGARSGGMGVMEAPQAFHEHQSGTLREFDQSPGINRQGGKPGQGYQAVRQGSVVRRLTTLECTRLQGFPDDWFGQPNAQPDGPRYAALGDAVTVPVARWIGDRLARAWCAELAGTSLPGTEQILALRRREHDVTGPVLEDLL